MAVNLLHKLPLAYSENGIQYYTRNNKQVNSGKNLTKSNNHQINNMSNNKGLSDVNRINEVNISNKMTSVEFIEKHLFLDDNWKRIFQQAKEMEKQQIIDFAVWFNNRNNEYQSYESIIEQYYNETFNK